MNSQFFSNFAMKKPVIIVFLRFVEKGDKVALLLDYDGTLAPLAAHPSMTVMEPDSENALKKLATHPDVFLAVISGRTAEDAKNKVSIDNITYAGNHGLEILYANGTKFQYEVSAELKNNFTKLVQELEQKVICSSRNVNILTRTMF